MNSSGTQQERSLARRMLRGWRHEWLLWALAWCVARGLLLVAFADVFGYGEELEKACAGKAMLDGLPIPHHELAYHYYEGGGFVVSHLDALAFAVLGESLLAVKLVALGLGAFLLWAGWRLCERLGGRNSARVFALLFIFAPTSVQKLSLLSLGIHFHALLFVAIVLALTARMIVERKSEPRAWFELGIAAGFGLYFSYQLALTILVTCTALVIFLRRDLFQRAAWFAVVGFVLGISPLLWMTAQVGGAVFDIHGVDVVGEQGSAKIDVLRAFFASIFVDRGALDSAALICLSAGPLLGLFALRSAAERSLRIGAWIVLLHIAIFLFAYIASSFTVGNVYHYFVLNRLTPLWWLAMLFMTLGAVAAWNTRQRFPRMCAAIVVTAITSFGALDMFRLVQAALATQPHAELSSLLRANVDSLARTKGYVYPEYLRKISPHITGTSGDKLRIFLHFRESRPTLLHTGIALALYGDGSRTIDEVGREVAAASILDPRGFFLGLGPLLRMQMRGDMASRVRALESHPAALRDALTEAIGCLGLGVLSTEDRVIEELRQGLAGNLPAAFFIGSGRRMHDARGMVTMLRYFEMTNGPWMLNRGRAYALAATLPDEMASALMVGYDAAHLERWLD